MCLSLESNLLNSSEEPSSCMFGLETIVHTTVTEK